MQVLSEIVTDYVGKKHAAGREWYRWRFEPKTVPPGVLDKPLQGQTWYDKNVELKERLHQSWRNGDAPRKAELEAYYIADWGGVRTNRSETLAKFHGASAEENIAREKSGIASWSKALCVRNPLKYAIFDARVAASLNALQVIHGVDSKEAVRFPLLASRNTVVRPGNSQLQKYFQAHGWPRVRPAFYTDYLALCQRTGARLGAPGAPWPIYAVEMALFAHTELLLREAFPHAQVS